MLVSLVIVSLLIEGASSAEQPKYGGTMIVALPGDPAHLNGCITTAAVEQQVADQMLNSLVDINLNMEYVPRGLAESWVISSDGKTYRFNLVRNATWHDGKPFTAADV